MKNHILNRFDTFTQILITPLDILLAQKFYAICNRPKNKGRDFYDIVFLLSLVQTPNYDYLHFKLGINNATSLKERILEKCNTLNMDEMARDVQPFLFNQSEIKKVLLFSELIQQTKL